MPFKIDYPQTDPDYKTVLRSCMISTLDSLNAWGRMAFQTPRSYNKWLRFSNRLESWIYDQSEKPSPKDIQAVRSMFQRSKLSSLTKGWALNLLNELTSD